MSVESVPDERGDGMPDIGRDDGEGYAPMVAADYHERIVDQATKVIEARERDMYEAMRERDEARTEVELGKALVRVLREACRDTGGPGVPKPVADAIAGLRVWADA